MIDKTVAQANFEYVQAHIQSGGKLPILEAALALTRIFASVDYSKLIASHTAQIEFLLFRERVAQDAVAGDAKALEKSLSWFLYIAVVYGIVDKVKDTITSYPHLRDYFSACLKATSGFLNETMPFLELS